MKREERRSELLRDSSMNKVEEEETVDVQLRVELVGGLSLLVARVEASKAGWTDGRTDG